LGSSIFVVIKETLPTADGLSARANSSRALATSGHLPVSNNNDDVSNNSSIPANSNDCTPRSGEGKDKESSSVSSEQQGSFERMFTYYFAQELEREKFAMLSGLSSLGAPPQSTHMHFVFHDTRGKTLSLGSGGNITNYTVISALVVEGTLFFFFFIVNFKFSV
jgi:hypothetical protein